MNTDSQVKKEKGSCHLYVYPFGLEQMDLDQQIKFINRIGFRGFAWEGTDQSTKDYFQFIDMGLDKFITDPYVSLASGNLCITISVIFMYVSSSS